MSTLNTFPYYNPSNGSVYRVKVNNDTDSVEIACIGMDCIDSPIKDGYYCHKDVPEWMANKLAVLGITTYGATQAWLDGVGKRIDEDTYWVYAP
jgi:hypothetical protein